jgi:hypothetical protein
VVTQNGTKLPAKREIPLPCTVADTVRVESRTKSNFVYILRMPKLRDRWAFENKMSLYLRDRNPLHDQIKIIRKNEDKLNEIVGKPVLLETAIQLLEKGEDITRVDIPDVEADIKELEEKQAKTSIPEEIAEFSERKENLVELLATARKNQEVSQAWYEYDQEALRLDSRYFELKERQGRANTEYRIEMIKACLTAAESNGELTENLDQEEIDDIMDHMSFLDLVTLYNMASDLHNVPSDIKKN